MLKLNNQFISKEILPSSLVFDDFVRLLCFHCKNYNHKNTCPPKIPNINYEKLLKDERNKLLVVYKYFPYDQNFDKIRKESTIDIHNEMLLLEKQLYERGVFFKISFIGGSCKICEKCNNICSPCARIPWEATGCDVVKTLQNNNINVTFPINGQFGRYGLLVWR